MYEKKEGRTRTGHKITQRGDGASRGWSAEEPVGGAMFFPVRTNDAERRRLWKNSPACGKLSLFCGKLSAVFLVCFRKRIFKINKWIFFSRFSFLALSLQSENGSGFIARPRGNAVRIGDSARCCDSCFVSKPLKATALLFRGKALGNGKSQNTCRDFLLSAPCLGTKDGAAAELSEISET